MAQTQEQRSASPGKTDWRYEAAWVWAPLVLRLALGIIFIAHGSQKVFGAFGGPGIKPVIGMVESLGFQPAWLWGWAAALAEFLGGMGILVGLLTRYAAAAVAVNMLVAVSKVHLSNGFFAPKGFEFPMALLAMAIALALSGAGRISLDWLVRSYLNGRGR